MTYKIKHFNFNYKFKKFLKEYEQNKAMFEKNVMQIVDVFENILSKF